MDPGVTLFEPIRLAAHKLPGRFSHLAYYFIQADRSPQIIRDLTIADSGHRRQIWSISSFKQFFYFSDEAHIQHRVDPGIDPSVKFRSW